MITRKIGLVKLSEGLELLGGPLTPRLWVSGVNGYWLLFQCQIIEPLCHAVLIALDKNRRKRSTGVQGVDEAVNGDKLLAGGFAPRPLAHKLANGREISRVCISVVLFFPRLPCESVTTCRAV